MGIHPIALGQEPLGSPAETLQTQTSPGGCWSLRRLPWPASATRDSGAGGELEETNRVDCQPDMVQLRFSVKVLKGGVLRFRLLGCPGIPSLEPHDPNRKWAQRRSETCPTR